jgi:outer membrane biogenesis lipoprotein LolB
MDFMKTLGVATLIALLAACSSPQDKAAKAQQGSYEAQEQVAKQRLDLVNKYQQCVKEAGDNQQKAATCDSYLKAAEALK